MKKYFILIVMVCSILVSCKPDPKLPEVTTNSVSGITDTTAVCTGEITDDGNADITARGFCWSTDEKPTLEDNFTKEGNGVDIYTSTLSELTPNTKYHVRAYATNSVGTAYGNELTFNTLESENGAVEELPTVTIVVASEVSNCSAMVSAEVLADGGAEVTERGFIWHKTNVDDTESIEPNRVKVGEGLGVYTHQLTGLLASTEYYVCAYAVNSVGEIVTDAIHFTTLPEEEEAVYEYVDLGLPSGTKWAKWNVGATAPYEYGDHFAWGELETKDDFLSSNCTTYKQNLGVISGNPDYDVATAKWGSDWRIPTLEEMFELTQKCTWIWAKVNGVEGFNVVSNVNGEHIFLPASGFRVNTGENTELLDRDVYGYYWTATPYDEEGGSTYTKACFLDMCKEQVYCNWSLRRNGFTVRPVRN